MSNGAADRLLKQIEKEERYDKRKRKREVNKRARRVDIQGSGKSGYKRTRTKFNSITLCR